MIMSQSNFHRGDTASAVRSALSAGKAPHPAGHASAWPAGSRAPDRRAELDRLGEQLERAIERIDANPIMRRYR